MKKSLYLYFVSIPFCLSCGGGQNVQLEAAAAASVQTEESVSLLASLGQGKSGTIGVPMAAPASISSFSGGTIASHEAPIKVAMPTASMDEMKALTDGANWFSGIQPEPRTRGLTSDLFTALVEKVVRVQTADGLGSGVVIGENGLILTNWHNLRDLTWAWIYYRPKTGASPTTRYRAVLERVSVEKDLALLRVTTESTHVEPVTLAPVSPIGVGGEVIAIGHPYGEQWTLTKGIVSQYRENYSWKYADNSEHAATVIQTQTPINPGNSGGPLFNDQGELVGINTFGGKGEGINFAVSIETISDFLADPVTTEDAPEAEEKMPVKEWVPWRDRDEDGEWDVWAFDRDGNGVPQQWLLDNDYNGRPEVLFYDVDENDIVERADYSDPENLFFEAEFFRFDYDQDGKWDEQAVDKDGDWEPDVFQTIFDEEECTTLAPMLQQCWPDVFGGAEVSVDSLVNHCATELEERTERAIILLGCMRKSEGCDVMTSCADTAFAQPTDSAQ